jgi:hypothetical protein
MEANYKITTRKINRTEGFGEYLKRRKCVFSKEVYRGKLALNHEVYKKNGK